MVSVDARNELAVSFKRIYEFRLQFTCVDSRPSSVELNSLLMFGAVVDDAVTDDDDVVDVDVDDVVAAAAAAVDFDFVASFKLLLLPSCQYCCKSIKMQECTN